MPSKTSIMILVMLWENHRMITSVLGRSACLGNGLRCAMVLVVASPLAGCAQSYTLTDLGIHGGDSDAPTNLVYRLNDCGQVTGYRAESGRRDGPFIWENGAIRLLGTRGNSFGEALGINNRGEVVGATDIDDAEDLFHAFLWRDGSLRDLGAFGPEEWSIANAINDAGVVVGEGSTPDGGQRAFRWEEGVMTSLGSLAEGSPTATAINNHGEIVGNLVVPGGGQRSFIWQEGVLTDLGQLGEPTEHPVTWATDINSLGEVVGSSITDEGNQHAYRWEAGIMTSLGTLGGSHSWATAINDDGKIVGGSRTRSGVVHAFLWDSGTMYDLNELTPTGLFAPILADGLDINSSGQILVDGDQGLVTRYFLMIPQGESGAQASELCEGNGVSFRPAGMCGFGAAGFVSLIVIALSLGIVRRSVRGR